MIDSTTILEAYQRISPYIHNTPVMTSGWFNQVSGGELFFKCENLQKAGAFKSRGAANAVFLLNQDELLKGVCTHSSGNHAAALSRAAALRCIPAYVVMPENSSKVKVEAVKHYKGNITFCKPTLQSREDTLQEVVRQTGAIEIHPYNSETIIAGQATAAYELLLSIPHLDYILAPVGGGGLLSGTALSSRFFSPATRVIAVEPANADDAFRSFRAGHIIPSVNPDTIADGLRTSLGSVTFGIIQKHVHDIITVSESAIIGTMRMMWERMKIIVEPSSAVPLAAVMENKINLKGKRAGIIISGGNVDLDHLPWIG